jgi:hypothetical protein
VAAHLQRLGKQVVVDREIRGHRAPPSTQNLTQRRPPGQAELRRILPATARTLRGAAPQMQTIDSMQNAMETHHPSV